MGFWSGKGTACIGRSVILEPWFLLLSCIEIEKMKTYASSLLLWISVVNVCIFHFCPLLFFCHVCWGEGEAQWGMWGLAGQHSHLIEPNYLPSLSLQLSPWMLVKFVTTDFIGRSAQSAAVRFTPYVSQTFSTTLCPHPTPSLKTFFHS